MKKIILSFIVLGTLCLSMIGCSNKNNTETTTPAVDQPTTAASITPALTATPAPTEAVLTEKDFAPSEENVRFLGRTYSIKDNLWLSYSASGMEFTFTGTKAEITLIGDNIATSPMGEGHYCRIGIYANDQLVTDELLKEHTKTYTAFESDKEETVTIRVIKLSETADSTVGIDNIKVISKEAIKPTEPKTHRIEFIGDSITCGFGVDDNNPNGAYTTATEDATKTYAYKTAQALASDYSMVSISGYGIISGYTANGTLNSQQIIPPFYEKMGFSYGSFNNYFKVDTLAWNFDRFKPDLIVINLGTNDNSYTGSDPARQEEYATGYVAFLKQVREKNPDSVILCTLGMMGNALFPSIEKAVSQYSDETGDTKVHTLKFDVQEASDGYGACWHPSEKTHTKAAEKLTAEIKSIMGW